MRTFFTSDTHFGHEAIIRYAHRPFSSVEEMDEVLVENWNRTVRPGDRVYHLGDFAVTPSHARRIRPRLNGTIRLTLGNHDDILKMQGLFQRVYLFRVFREQGLQISHMPIAPDQRRAPISVHGHTHAPYSLDVENRQISICVESTGYTPMSEELLFHAAGLLGSGEESR